MTKILNKKDIVYYARIIPSSGIYDVCELTLRTITDTYIVGVDKKDKRVYLLGYNTIDDVVFSDRKAAVKKVNEAEKNKIEISNEIYYEEY